MALKEILNPMFQAQVKITENYKVARKDKKRNKENQWIHTFQEQYRNYKSTPHTMKYCPLFNSSSVDKTKQHELMRQS